MLRTTITAALAIAASALSVLAATPAVAAEPRSEPASVRVRTADLDLTSAAGLNTLNGRLKAAVHEVCPYRPTADVMTFLEHRACIQSAKRSANRGRESALAHARTIAFQVATAAR